MKVLNRIIPYFAAGLMVASVAWQSQTKKDIQAVLVKVVRDVEKKGGTTAWQKAVSADQLKAGYQVKTNRGSAALISFLDNSKIVVRENSIVQIKGQVQGKQIIDRDVYMERGKLQFDVRKQETEQFRFTSPISVASIRGTGGEINSYGGDSSSALCTHGSFDFVNTRSNRQITVGAGQIAFTYSDGSVTSRRASQNEVGNANTNIGGQGGGTGGTGGTGGGSRDTTHVGSTPSKELIIYGEDQNGQPKRIIIKIQQ